MIYITGDTHGEQARFYNEMLLPNGRLGEKDYLIVCGDFGYIFSDDSSEAFFLDSLERVPYTILFVDGNHENFPALFSYPEMEWHGGCVHRIRKNVFHLMRGEIFEIDGSTFFVMGGAYSIDRYMRSEGVSWWPEELPCELEYKRAVASLKEKDFKVDYILTHTMPREMILRYGKNPDMHDMELTGFLEWIMYEVEYRHWFCGHWHDDRDLDDKFTILWHNFCVV